MESIKTSLFGAGRGESEVTQLCPTLRYPMDCSLPDSSIHGVFQARVLEWGAIAFFGWVIKGYTNEKWLYCETIVI